jgi:hypothetical protein
MTQGVHVRSLGAVADFRAALIGFADEIGRLLEEVNIEVDRFVEWVRDDRPQFWKEETRRAWDRVTLARNELERAQNMLLDGQRPTCYREKKALEAAKRYAHHCEEQVRIVRRWASALQHEVAEYQGRISQLQGMLDIDVPQAVALLDRMILALESYVATAPPAFKVNPSEAVDSPAGAARRAAAPAAGPPDDSARHPYEYLRQRTPSGATRVAFDPPPLRGPVPVIVDYERPAKKFAEEAGAAPAYPSSRDKVLVAPGVLGQREVYLERIGDGGPRDSGWFIGPLDRDPPPLLEFEALRMADLLERRPELLKVCALPPGYLVVMSGDTVTAVVDEADRLVYALEGARP